MERRTTGTVEANGIRMAYAESGSGSDVVLLVHGFTGAKEDFSDHLDPLADLGWRVLAPDLRGHGETSGPPGTDRYTFDLLRADVEAFIDALGLERLVLLGHSMGGVVAQHLARADAGRLRGLVLMDTTHGPSGMDPELVEAGIALVRDEGIDALADLLALAPGANSTEAHQRLIRERDGFAEFGDRKLRSVSGDMFQAMARQLLDRTSELDSLGTVSLPTLVMVGALDEPFVQPSRDLAATIETARLVEIPGAGHNPQFEAPELWLEAMTSFLEVLP
jgi:2-succinyl-6-hydroxy-2,4-cyclohexadiene-1-carboxylate synthase